MIFWLLVPAIAGLYAALKLLPQGAITLLTKKALTESNTDLEAAHQKPRVLHAQGDATRIKDPFAKRFPTIYQNCLKMGINPQQAYIPVAPAAHYTMGGIKTDTWGQTNLYYLYACGECSSTRGTRCQSPGQ